MEKLKKIVIVSFLFIVIFGCQKPEPQNKKNLKIEKKKNYRVIVLGIDETGSYKLWNQARDMAIKIIEQLEPGDIFYLRRITSASYLDSCTIFRLELPLIELPENGNPFDRKMKSLQESQMFQIKLFKGEAIKRLNAVRFTDAKYTDIYGFLAAASDRFSIAPKSFQRNLIIASDLIDNVNYKIKLNLQGVQVAVIGFQTSKDPRKTQKLRYKWEKKFTNAGAVKIYFLPIEERFTMDFFGRI